MTVLSIISANCAAIVVVLDVAETTDWHWKAVSLLSSWLVSSVLLPYTLFHSNHYGLSIITGLDYWTDLFCTKNHFYGL